VKIILSRPNWISVDGVSYRGSLDLLDPKIRRLEVDTSTGQGVREFVEGEVKGVIVRDLEAEDAAYAAAVAKNQDVSKLQPSYKRVEIARPAEPLDQFDYVPFYNIWLKAKEAHDKEMADARARALEGKAFL
jgi:hypothetical protein